MKSIMVLSVGTLLSVGIFLISIAYSPIKADPQVRKSYDFVIVQGYPDFRQTVDQYGKASYSWHGCFVYNYNSSSNAPSIPPTVDVNWPPPVESRTNNLAQTLADLSNQGFEIISSSGDSTSELTYVLRRLRIHP